jgi:hypothetical protein
MIRPDLAHAVREGWRWAKEHNLTTGSSCIKEVSDEARRRYTRLDRCRAFAKAAMACAIHRN